MGDQAKSRSDGSGNKDTWCIFATVAHSRGYTVVLRQQLEITLGSEQRARDALAASEEARAFAEVARDAYKQQVHHLEAQLAAQQVEASRLAAYARSRDDALRRELAREQSILVQSDLKAGLAAAHIAGLQRHIDELSEAASVASVDADELASLDACAVANELPDAQQAPAGEAEPGGSAVERGVTKRDLAIARAQLSEAHERINQLTASLVSSQELCRVLGVQNRGFRLALNVPDEPQPAPQPPAVVQQLIDEARQLRERLLQSEDRVRLLRARVRADRKASGLRERAESQQARNMDQIEQRFALEKRVLVLQQRVRELEGIVARLTGRPGASASDSEGPPAAGQGAIESPGSGARAQTHAASVGACERCPGFSAELSRVRQKNMRMHSLLRRMQAELHAARRTLERVRGSVAEQ